MSGKKPLDLLPASAPTLHFRPGMPPVAFGGHVYLIKEAARLSGVSVRALRHYDRIGLLVPCKAANGYRYYDEENLNVLQQICFYKYLGFSLKDIRRLLTQPPREHLAVLREQRALLGREKTRLLKLIQTLEQSIAALEGETTMTAQEKFAGFTYDDFLAHADEKYGDHLEEMLARHKGKEDVLMQAFNSAFSRFAEYQQRHLPVSNSAPQQAADDLYRLIRDYSLDCTPNAFASIGEIYVDDPRFKANIDQFGSGTAKYARDAIRHYVDARQPV